MWQERTFPLDSSLTKPVGSGKKRGKKREREGEGRISREISSTFSLDLQAIKPSVRVEVRGKVLARDKSCK